jgi:predicted ATPase/DNA-binding SARP family transcriptional activator/DNA-binding CsgD family transcriptional regulator
MGGPEAVRIGLFGGFRVWVGPRLVGEDGWRLRKARSLVKLLALSPEHRVHREQAMELFWPDLDPQSASNNLHQVLHAARRALEPSVATGGASPSGYLLLREEQIVLCPDCAVWVDVEAFEEAAVGARHAMEPQAFGAAIDLYAGELLPEDRYEVWTEERRAHLREVYLSLLLELAALYEERGEYEAAIEALGRAVAEEPTREGAHADLMRLYALSGRRREALSQYERLREVLSDDLGMEPGTEITRLQQEIWIGDFPVEEDFRSGAVPVSATAGKHNLPLSRTSFVGREREMLEVKRHLAMTSLLTLTGAGGCGKTRLALEVARDLVGAFPDGVWLVELAPLSEPALLAQAVAQAVGVREQPGRSLTQTLQNALRVKKTLLIVDNCEHLVGAVVGLIDALLDHCPRLRVLATSRERLNAAGEVGWVVPSLTVPDAVPKARWNSEPRELEAYESVRLFVQRARQRDPSFELDVANGEAVSQVCRRLEGIPHAVELAAARTGVLSARQLANRLEDSLELLSRGERTGDPRHQSLRAALEWSHDLLGEEERVLFRRLSVFAGRWTLEVAEEVCSGEGIQQVEILDLLSELVERSLVVSEASPEEGVVRFRLLEPTRQYGRERLQESGEADTVLRRHAAWYLAFAEEAEPALKGKQQESWSERLEREYGNLRAALSWALERGEAELGLRLAAALGGFWHMLSGYREGQRWLEAALANGETVLTSVRVKALHWASQMAWERGDCERSMAFSEEGLALSRELGDTAYIAAALFDLGAAAAFQNELERASALAEEAMTLQRELGDEVGLARSLLVLGLVALARYDYEQVMMLQEESLALAHKMEDDFAIILSLQHLAIASLYQGDYRRARALYKRGLELCRQQKTRHLTVAHLHVSAALAASQGRPQRSARLWAAAAALREAIGATLPPFKRRGWDPYIDTARAQLDEEAWEAAWAEGRAMPPEQAIEYALAEEEDPELPTLIAVPEQHSPPADERAERLTAREREVALLVSRGLTNRQIARKLSISEHTAANHVRRILKKLGVRSRTQIPTTSPER